MEVKDIFFEELLKTNKSIYIPIDKIAGIPITANIYSHDCSSSRYLQFNIVSDWLDKCLFSARIFNEEELKDLFSKIIPLLQYDKLLNKLFVDIGEHDNIVYDLLKLIPKTDNIVLQFQECSVCLDSCITKTSCNHFICGLCEGKMTTKKCPICRDYYIHPANHDLDDE